MNTKQLYWEISASAEDKLTSDEHRLYVRRHFAEELVRLDDIPMDCEWCVFRVSKVNKACLLREDFDYDDYPKCIVYDFTKWLLEHV